ncbi:ribbon-helix-helix domain-containing protein [Roseospira marina]|uniref:Ribbon-helix-helix domain-containing protein n=1 Tax=Roseospira marina TaxID=140057 RepID=A0A5M6IG73_9PROT|nr:ribbon-helix-helix domain-containing protein [Roseospira marina]KAA5607321.1 ribbon-helix-helix domain-containing protein [Roseospira marina]MBB4312519.1 putative DNA-binding ribbon-helix-helix protein [Roseospira marina]MBB5085465.1 putative DNA-binding ribbon-helix-helix protein [Roseospira marina]
MSSVRKRSITIAGHATSISLEEPFWDALREIAVARGQSVAEVVTEIDAGRATGPDGPRGNLSSALRVHVLAYYRDPSTEPTAPSVPED